MFNKNLKSTICIALLLVTVILIFCGCSDPETGLSKSLTRKIKRSFMELSDSDSQYDIAAYYGTYNDCVAIMFQHGTTSACWDETVADIKIGYGDGRRIWAWKGGVLAKLSEAYDNGWLTKENIQSIADKHHGNL